MSQTVAQGIALALQAYKSCQHAAEHPDTATKVVDGDQDVTAKHWAEMAGNHRDVVNKITKDQLPSGSGWDLGTELDFDRSTPDRLVFYGEFHHMAESGMYDGWTEHSIIVTASLAFGLEIRVTGRNRNGIKDYLTETFDAALSAELVR